MKHFNQNCPWGEEIQKLVGCKCPKTDICSGFCTFPCNNKLVIPSGLSTNNFIEIPSANFERIIKVEEDINVSDDLEIYFVPANEVENLKNKINNINKDNLEIILSSIFQGFGDCKWVNKDEIKYNRPEILPQNNAENINNNYYLSGFNISKFTTFNVAHTIKANTIISGFSPADFNNERTNEMLSSLPSGYNAVIRPRSWWSNEISCTGKIKLIPIEYPVTEISGILNIASHYDYIETTARCI
jgi:hypothetical protein